jgi:ankyrin repeat protein
MNRVARWSLVPILGLLFLAPSPPAEAKAKLEGNLLAAISQGDTVKVHELLGRGADPNYADESGRTPLMAAVGVRGKEMQVFGSGGREAFERSGYAAIAESLAREERQRAATTVQALLAAGAAPDARDKKSNTALMFAAQFGDTASLRALLDSHADLSLRNDRGLTALHLAAGEGHANVVRRLLELGAAPNVGSNDQTTPLQYALGAGQIETARILLKGGANPKATDAHGQTVLMTAAYHGLVDVMDELVAAGVDVMTKDDGGNTALANAAYTGKEAAVQWLLDHGAEINARNLDGTTALGFAKKSHHPDVAALLRSKGGTE